MAVSVLVRLFNSPHRQVFLNEIGIDRDLQNIITPISALVILAALGSTVMKEGEPSHWSVHLAVPFFILLLAAMVGAMAVFVFQPLFGPMLG